MFYFHAMKHYLKSSGVVWLNIAWTLHVACFVHKVLENEWEIHIPMHPFLQRLQCTGLYGITS